MYIGFVSTAKKMLEKVLNDGDAKTVSAEDVLNALKVAYYAIEQLESETNYEYESGKADGMERMAEIIFGAEKERADGVDTN